MLRTRPAVAVLLLAIALSNCTPESNSAEQTTFEQQIKPLLATYCVDCHNADEMTSGIRVDHLDGSFNDRHLFLWKDILKQVSSEAMPPNDAEHPTDAERKRFVEWIDQFLITARTRKAEKNGSVRRLTVAQYRNTLRDLLGLEDELTDVLPPDAVSKDGFVNNEQTLELSPLLLEAYFDIASKALDRCIVDPHSTPVIQSFRMDLGNSVNPEPFPERLILGANNHLLSNEDFIVTQSVPTKPFEFQPFAMRTKWRFHEGYQGNSTVRGWREYDSIYHAVFACMRGNPGYPKGLAYHLVPEGLLLRPAIPSAELFQVESTYGPKANFKISLRELPDFGRFRVTVKAAKYDDGLLLDPGTPRLTKELDGTVIARDLTEPRTVEIQQPGLYQADVYLRTADSVAPDASKLNDGLVGAWSFDGNATGRGAKEYTGKLVGGAKFVDSPFGSKAVQFDGQSGSVVVPRDETMNVGKGDFTVAAWIHPRGLRQGGFVCLGRYNYTHGWYFDMPNNQGVLRIETMDSNRERNGTVQSKPGVIRNNTWQHVAAVVRRGVNRTRLYVNGFEVAVGSIHGADLDNPTTSLHIGRIEDAQLFKGEIDNVHIFRRALDVAEIQALVEPGRQFVAPPPTEKGKNLYLTLNGRQFAGARRQEAFAALSLPAGPLEVSTRYDGKAAVDRVVFTPLPPTHEVAQKLAAFDRRSPKLGVHMGLRRDCGSTFVPVEKPQAVASTDLTEFVFEGAISNFPSPDVQKDNDNYLAGIREIGVRSEYTDGREMPRLLIRSVEFEGPYYETWPPATHRSIFIDSPAQNDPPAYARDIIRSFASRAFRRPATDSEFASLFAVWETSFVESGDFEGSIKDALVVALTSPQFVFLIEDSHTPEPEPIASYELASKLSYFLWNAAPDARLLELAAADTLRQSLDSEVKRMIRDPRFEQFTHEFASQWLNLDKLDVVETDRRRFPKLTRDAKTHLRAEPVQLLQHLIRHNLPARHLIESDFIVANEVVASYYGLGDHTESGFEYAPLRHKSPYLGGVLTQAGILAGLSDGRESNPVKRGAWLARKIIAEPPDDPPPNVPDLEQDTSQLPLRERLEKHRNQPGCAKCHSGIDPWGVPFEQIDAGGLFKQGTAVDASSTLPDETEVADLNGLKSYLANDRIDQVAFSVLKHLATYATGRTLTYSEIEFLKENGIALKADGYRMQDMIRFVVNSEMFLEK